jgi:hypothetical protein
MVLSTPTDIWTLKPCSCNFSSTRLISPTAAFLSITIIIVFPPFNQFSGKTVRLSAAGGEKKPLVNNITNGSNPLLIFPPSCRSTLLHSTGKPYYKFKHIIIWPVFSSKTNLKLFKK